MKKILLILTVAVIVCLSFTLTACNSATPQGLLGEYWCDYETFGYRVTDKTDAQNPVTGTYRSSVEKFDKGSSVTLAQNFVLENVEKGYLVTGRLVMEDKTINTACYFIVASEDGSFLIPLASYRKEATVSSLTVTKMNYTGNVCQYTVVKNETDTTSGTITCGSPYYDTNEIYCTLRGASSLGTGFSMTMNVALPSENAAASLTASCNSTVTIESPDASADELYGNGLNCYCVNISRKTTVAGIYYTAYYGAEQITVSNWKITRPLVKLIEGNVEYDLISVDVTKA